MREVEITTEYIQLDQLLKYANIAQTGGHAKILIRQGMITLNDQIETRRGKKIYPGDIVNINVKEDYNFEEDEISLKIVSK